MKISLLALAIASTTTACMAPEEEDVGSQTLATAPSGATGILRGRAALTDTEVAITWEGHVYKIEAEAGENSVHLAMQDVIFAPNGHTGWHTHAGPVVAMITQG